MTDINRQLLDALKALHRQASMSDDVAYTTANVNAAQVIAAAEETSR